MFSSLKPTPEQAAYALKLARMLAAERQALEDEAIRKGRAAATDRAFAALKRGDGDWHFHLPLGDKITQMAEMMARLIREA